MKKFRIVGTVRGTGIKVVSQRSYPMDEGEWFEVYLQTFDTDLKILIEAQVIDCACYDTEEFPIKRKWYEIFYK